MYIPRDFEETRVAVLREFVREHPFCTLVTAGSGGLIASHIPMGLEAEGDESGVLKGHVSRANPQWKTFDPEVEALAIFSGPEHYISPSWYAEKAATGKVVPTWNYAVVHVYGRLKTVDDAEWLRRHVEALTAIHEAEMREPWSVTDAPEDYLSAMVRGIVGMELAVTRIEGKWKASQNRSESDRRGVLRGLDELGTDRSRAMRLMVDERM